MAKHSAPVTVGRKDAAVINIQLHITIPAEYRKTYPYPERTDAVNIARALGERCQRGELHIQELLEMADDITWQYTKPAGLRLQ